MLRTLLPRRRDCGRETRSSGKKTKRRKGERHNANHSTRTWYRCIAVGGCLIARFLCIMLALPGVLSDRDSIVGLTTLQRAPAQRQGCPQRARSTPTARSNARKQSAVPRERELIYRIAAGPPQGFGASRPRLCRALAPTGRDAGSGGVQPMNREARMNILEFATVLTAVMRHNIRRHPTSERRYAGVYIAVSGLAAGGGAMSPTATSRGAGRPALEA